MPQLNTTLIRFVTTTFGLKSLLGKSRVRSPDSLPRDANIPMRKVLCGLKRTRKVLRFLVLAISFFPAFRVFWEMEVVTKEAPLPTPPFASPRVREKSGALPPSAAAQAKHSSEN